MKLKDIKVDEPCEIEGFIDRIRVQKTMVFIVLKDRTAAIQVAIEKSQMPPEKLTRGSVLKVKGVAVKAERVRLGGIEFLPSGIEVESPAEPLPIDGETAGEQRFDYRWIDLREEKKRLIFEIRTYVESVMREYFLKEDFIEIHTPKISAQCSEGGAEVFAIDYYGQKAYLTQSPQFYKQMAMAAGFERVFEIGPYYRAENSFTSRHASESVCLDFEMSGLTSHHQIMDFEEGWIIYVLQKTQERFGDKIREEFKSEVKIPTKIPRIKLQDVFKIFKEVYNIDTPQAEQLDLGREAEELICDYAKEYLDSEFVFITDYPAEARAFYSKKSGEYGSMTFDMLYRGWEMNSGALREHRYDILKSQIEERGIDSKKMEGYLEFFRYGCPPHGGIGFGIDRFIAKLLNLASVKESIFVFRGPGCLKP